MVGNVLVYVVFVETKNSYKWDSFDVNSTMDSLNKALSWIEAQAKKSNIEKLRFTVDNYRNDSTQYIYQNIKGGSFKKLISKYGTEEVDKWGDKVVKKAFDVKNRAELIADLRNTYSVESVALIYMVNNYFRSDFSYAFNTGSNEDVEYAVMSTKEPSRIAQEILSLFGAHYLHNHPSVGDKRNRGRLKKMFPYDIMADPKKNIQQLYVGEITQYYIGWNDGINDSYQRMINNAKYKF